MLAPLGEKTSIPLAKLRQPGLLRRTDFWARAEPVRFGPGPFDGITLLVPVFDLHYYAQASAGPNAVPPDYWISLAQFLVEWIDHREPRDGDALLSDDETEVL